MILDVHYFLTSKFYSFKLSRNKMEIYVIILIGIGIIIAIFLFFKALPVIGVCAQRIWNNLLAPPIYCLNEHICAPIGVCCRDCVFTVKAT